MEGVEKRMRAFVVDDPTLEDTFWSSRNGEQIGKYDDPSLQDTYWPSHNKDKVGNPSIDEIDDAFWPSLSTSNDPAEDSFMMSMSSEQVDNRDPSEDELTDEEDAVKQVTRISPQSFNFYQESQRLHTNAADTEEGAVKAVKPDPHLTYLSFSPQDSNLGPGAVVADVIVSVSLDSVEDDSTLITDADGVVVLPDIDDENEDDIEAVTSSTSYSTDSTNSSPPTHSSPSASPIRTCKAPSNRVTVISITGANTNNRWESPENSKKQKRSAKIRVKREKQNSRSSQSTRTKKSTSSQSTRTKKSTTSQSTRTKNQDKQRRPARRARSTSSGDLTSRCSNMGSVLGPQPTTPTTPTKKANHKAPRRLDSSGNLSLADVTVTSRWHRQCENFFFDMWDNDIDDLKDDVTLATFEEEMSCEDEGNVDVLVAVQATVLGTDVPEATLDAPKKKSMPHIWGNNFVGVAQPPKGDAVLSRKFPPGCRVASISAWSAAANKPYFVCNSSNLLIVPPMDGLHLDGTEVSVLMAAYLPAFQALHHGQRHNRHAAYEATAFEGQRVLILAHKVGDPGKISSLDQSLVDARVQAAVRMALWAGARDVHVTVEKVGNTKRNIFGNDYRVRLLDTPPEDWVPILKSRINLVLDFTGGSLFGTFSTCNIAEKVMSKKNGRYVGCLGEHCASNALHCREEAPTSKTKESTWSQGLSMLKGNIGWDIPGILPPDGKDIRHLVEWTAVCMKMQRASLFDFYGSWKQDRRLAEYDFNFLLELLAKRQIRPHIAKILDVDYFPSAASGPQIRSTRSMSGAVVCEPWAQFKDTDDISCCSDLS